MTMTMMLFLPRLLLLLVASLGLLTTAQQQQQYDCTYSDPLVLQGWGDGEVTLQHYANLQEETITLRLTVNQDSWLAIGINLDGGHSMTNSYAIIGDNRRDVQFYWMTSEAQDASGVMRMDDVHGQIRNKRFLQQETEYGEPQTVLEFSMNLAIADEDQDATVYHYISKDTAWIWAAGLPGNQWAGVHNTLGFFSGLEPYFDGCRLRVTNDTPTNDETVNEGQEAEDTNTQGQQDDSSGSASESSTPASGSRSPASSSSGSSSGGGGSGLVFGTSRAASNGNTHSLWAVHGIFMGIAWGIFAPLAIGAAYLKKRLQFLQHNAMWLSLHFYLSVSAVLFTFVGFIVGVVATKREGDLPHFAKDTHHKAGLAIFVLVLIQGLAGYFRPPPTTAPRAATKDDNDDISITRERRSSASDYSSSLHATTTSDTAEADGMEVRQKVRALKSASRREVVEGPRIEQTTTTTKPQKSRLRQYWEYLHRFLGMTLLGLAWYNCTSGIQLQAAKYSYEQDYDEEYLMNIFWSIAGTIGAVIFFIGYVIRAES